MCGIVQTTKSDETQLVAELKASQRFGPCAGKLVGILDKMYAGGILKNAIVLHQSLTNNL